MEVVEVGEGRSNSKLAERHKVLLERLRNRKSENENLSRRRKSRTSMYPPPLGSSERQTEEESIMSGKMDDIALHSALRAENPATVIQIDDLESEHETIDSIGDAPQLKFAMEVGQKSNDVTSSYSQIADNEVKILRGFDEQRKLHYYFNTKTQESSWEPPSDGRFQIVDDVDDDESSSENSDSSETGESSGDDGHPGNDIAGVSVAQIRNSDQNVSGLMTKENTNTYYEQPAMETIAQEREDGSLAWIGFELDAREVKGLIGDIFFSETEFRRFAYFSHAHQPPGLVVDRSRLMHCVAAQMRFEIDEAVFRNLVDESHKRQSLHRHYQRQQQQQQQADQADQAEGDRATCSKKGIEERGILISSSEELTDTMVRCLFAQSKFFSPVTHRASSVDYRQYTLNNARQPPFIPMREQLARNPYNSRPPPRARIPPTDAW